MIDLKKRLSELLTKHRVPGAAVGVLQNGEITEAAAGVINLNTGVEATTDTLFQIGSITKVWTTTMIMQLVDEGKIELDAPVRTYLPSFQVADEDVAAKVTLRHLLTHTSGIDGDHFPDHGRGDDCIERYVDACASLEQTHALGATMSYCNTGFTIAGRIIEVLDEKGWDQALRDRIITPLGLTHTNTLPEEALLFRAAVGHIAPAPGDDPQRAPAWVLPRVAGPMGLINSTVRDTLTFAKAHMDDGAPLLSERSAKAMQEPQVEVPNRHTLGSHWGLGWILFDWDGHRVYGHDGGTLGQAAFLRIAPDAGVAVALFTNGGDAGEVYRALYNEILGDLAGITMPALPELPSTPPDVDLSAYAGTYQRLGVTIELNVEGDKLVGSSTLSGPLAEMLPNPTTKIEAAPVDAETFLVATVGAKVPPVPGTFYNFEDGAPGYLHYGGRTHPRVR
ncbi:MAG: serine hydrolase domain-containing protein [Actinomycetota bacterium]